MHRCDGTFFRNFTRDGERPAGAGFQEQASNHLKQRLLRAEVVSVKAKAPIKVGRY